MKRTVKQLISIILSAFLFSIQTMAFSAHTATIDYESEIYSAFSELDELILVIENNNEITYEELLASNSALVENVSANAAVAMNASADSAPPFISAFLWGCIFNLPGMLVVGITTGFDSYHMKKSAWGCLIGSLVFSGSGLFFYQ